MRRELVWMCVGCLAVAAAAPRLCAQNTDRQKAQNHAPTADRFVSTPGQMVSTPGQMVTGPGQRVTGPGQMVIPPGQAVIPMGSSIAPVPGVITPFTNQSSASAGASQPAQAAPPSQGIVPGRRYHPRHVYRPGYGVAEAYALPYAINGDSAAGDAAASRSENPHAAAEARSMIAAPGIAASPAANASSMPSGNRPAYRPDDTATQAAPAPARDMIQSPEPLLTIVMKNGSRRTMRNYALTPQTLMDLDDAGSGREVSIPLSRINIPATEKAASQAGLSFVVPGK